MLVWKGGMQMGRVWIFRMYYKVDIGVGNEKGIWGRECWCGSGMSWVRLSFDGMACVAGFRAVKRASLKLPGIVFELG